MAECKTTIGKANVQRVYAMVEDVTGILQRPTPEGFISPAGQATMTQTPGFENSAELSETLNIIEQFQNAVEAGSISIPSYLRIKEGYAPPQGDALFQSLMGEVQPTGTVMAELVADATDADTEMTIDTVVGGFVPPRGIIEINAERILYRGRESTMISGQYKLLSLVRGYGKTVAAAHVATDALSLLSRVYMQAICRPTCSVWLQLDHTVLFMSGCSVSSLELALSNTGGQTVNFSMNGRKMGWCGESAITAIIGAVLTLEKDQHFAYSLGAIIKNHTKNDDNTGAGYTIIGIDEDANTITLNKTPTGWAINDVLKPWLPDAGAIGKAIESRSVRAFAGEAYGQLVTYKQKEGSISISTPTTFASEIGDDYPGDSSDGKRDIKISGGLYFRAKDVALIGKGYKGYEEHMAILFNTQAENSLALYMPRVKFNTPEPSTDGNYMTLTQNGTALGVSGERNGESALYLILE